MKRALVALSLLAAVRADAQVRVVIDAPAAAPAPVFSAPSVSLSSARLSPVLAVPTLSAPKPSLPQVQKISVEVAASVSAGREPGPVLDRAYDVSAGRGETSMPVLAGPSSQEPAPLARPTHANIVEDRQRGIRTILHETAEVGAMTLPFAFAAVLLRNWVSDPHIMIPAMIGLWSLAAWAMRDHLRGLRSTVVGGWQASHDQRYRVDTNTGRLRDVRGHKYGEDRYDEYAKGPAGRAATAVISVAAALAAAGFLLL